MQGNSLPTVSRPSLLKQLFINQLTSFYCYISLLDPWFYEAFKKYRNVTLGKNGLNFQETVLFLHWISHYSYKMQTIVKCIT